MKKKLRYKQLNKTVEREISFIPVRYIFAMLITIFEILAIIGIVAFLCYVVPYFYILAYITEIACVIKIIASNDNPDYKVPWLLVVLVLPIAGFMLYFIFASRKLKKRYVKRLKNIKEKCHIKNDEKEFEELKANDIKAYSQAKLITNLSKCSLYKNTYQTYFPSGEKAFESMIKDLKTAKRFILMEYFIIEQGKVWDTMLEVLKEKAKEGVDVRIVFDDIGCMNTLPGNYAKLLNKMGIKATPFSRLKGQADSEFNNRSHRKITVIDGEIAYTGGINIADEYANLKPRFGYWKDSAIRLEGDAVKTLTSLFLFDYGSNIKDELIMPENPYPETQVKDNGYIVPFGDGPKPLYDRRVSKVLIQNMLSVANDYAYITTPYLIIDNELCQSIENTALRGVDVRIIVPSVPDKKIVYSMTKSYYQRLLDAGVKIYEYTPGFIHAKTYLIDGKYALVGTVNLDYRSLVHHFENAVWLYNANCIKDIAEDVNEVISVSKEIEKGAIKTNIFERFFRALVRIFAPLL